MTEDPLKKREKFAVSLRKQKSQNLIKTKRMKMLQSLKPDLSNSGNSVFPASA